MQLNSILLLALCGFISASPLPKRDVATILFDISTVSGTVSSLTTYVNAYTGSTDQSSDLAASFDSLSASLKTATSDADSASEFNEADSESIANAVSTLTPQVITLISDLDAKASVVAAANYTSVVYSALVASMGDADDLLTALTDKVTEEQTAPLGTAADQINYAFNAAIAAY